MMIRDAARADLPHIQAIYAYHVLHGTGTFEEDPPDVEEMARRHGAVVANGLPWLVADIDGIVAGYAYAQKYHARSAWRFTVEDAIYVAPEQSRHGLGRALLRELIRRCKALGCRQMIAVIGDSGNEASIGLHAAAGFVRVGQLSKVGMKFGRELDVVVMQKNLVAANESREV